MWSSVGSPGSSRIGGGRSVWDVPIAIWAYGFLRSLAFIAPSWTEGGRIGLGVIPVLVLYVFLVRGSRRAWAALVFFDVLSYVMLMAAWFNADDAPLAIPFFAGASLAALLVPSTRHYVGAMKRPATASEHQSPTET